MSGIANLGHSCGYSTILQFIVRLSKFKDFVLKNDFQTDDKFFYIKNFFIQYFENSRNNVNFSQIIDPAELYINLNVDTNNDNIIEILDFFIDLFKKRIGNYDQNYIDFKILNANNEDCVFKSHYTIKYDKDKNLNQNFIETSRIFADFIFSIPIIAVFEIQNPKNFIPEDMINISDSDDNFFNYKLKGFFLFKRNISHWVFALRSKNFWLLFNDSKITLFDDNDTFFNSVDNFEKNCVIYIKETFYDDTSIFDNIFQCSIENISQSSDIYIQNTDEEISDCSFEYDSDTFISSPLENIKTDTDSINYYGFICQKKNKFILEDIDLPLIENELSLLFVSYFLPFHPILYNYVKNTNDFSYDLFLQYFKISNDDIYEFSQLHNYYGILNRENFPTFVKIAKKLQINFQKNNVVNNIFNYHIHNYAIPLDGRFIELLYYGNISIFEFNFAKSLFYNNDFIQNLPKPILSLERIPQEKYVEYEVDNNLNILKEYVRKIPNFIKEMDFHKTDYINQNLSLIYLGGNIKYKNMGTSSGKLYGTTYSKIRRIDSGFILLSNNVEKLPNTLNDIKDDVALLFDYLKENNPLYADFIPPKSQENLNDWIFTVIDNFRSKSGIVITDQYDNNNYMFKRINGVKLIRVAVESQKDGVKTLYVTFEEALALMFPILFPNGPIPPIEGKTFREKAKKLLSIQYFRIGLVACSMILYIFDIIVRDESLTYQHCVQKVRVQRPNDETGIGNDFKINSRDPSFHLYWLQKSTEVSAMIEQFGPPDLMLTLTFNNKWEEVKSFIDNNYMKYTNEKYKFLIQFAPVEEMMFWKYRFKEVFKNGFNNLFNSAGLGNCTHFFWRLEFQGRGAPHVHSLIWLENMLNIEQIDKNIFAELPQEFCTELHSKIKGYMIHNCVGCFKKGRVCRFNFPKKPVLFTHYNDEGFLELKRDEKNDRTVDFCPLLIAQTNSHTHVNVLRSEELPFGSTNGINYVLKYNFKPEPNMIIDGKKIDDKLRFRARVVSVEEAVARIFSFTFSEKDIGSIFIDTVPPSLRTAKANKNGKQKQIDIIEKYFNRPSYLDRLTILEYFSLYDINSAGNLRIIEPPAKNTLARPKNSLAPGSKWELENLNLDMSIELGFLYKSERLPNATRLKIKKLANPRIVTFKNFDFFQQEVNFYYHYLLISGCWRSEEDMMLSFSDPLDAIKYHGLCKPFFPEINPGIGLYLIYHIQLLRYTETHLKKMISNFMNQGVDTSDLLKVLNNYRPPIQRIKDRVELCMQYINDIKSVLMEEKPVSRNSFDVSNDILKKYICIDFTEKEKEESKNLFESNYPLLNEQQKAIVDKIITEIHLITNYCILGKAGTGKSFLIKTLMAYFRFNNIPYGVTASTGIAAALIHGRTLHSLFSLFSKDDDLCCGLTLSDVQGKALTNMKFLFIDEITMLSKKVFDVIDKKLRYLMIEKYGNSKDVPFGGLKLILTGDLAQVPAVLKTCLSDIDEAKNMFMSMENFDSFQFATLDINQRQKDADEDFIYLLNEVRDHQNNCKLSDKSLQLLKSIFIEGGMIKNTIDQVVDFVGDDGLTVFYTNDMLDIYNDLLLNKYHCDSIKVFDGLFIKKPQISYLHGNNRSNLTKFIHPSDKDISYMKYYLRKNSNLVPVHLKIAIGCKVMLLKNIDSSAGLVNGRIGFVENIMEHGKNGSDSPILLIKFKNLTDDGNEDSVEIIRHLICETDLPYGAKISFYQYPIKLCYGVTAHKVQGQTLKKVAINISKDAFAHGSFYVALSRVKNLADVRLFGPEKFPEEGPLFHNNGVIQAIGKEILNNEEDNTND